MCQLINIALFKNQIHLKQTEGFSNIQEMDRLTVNQKKNEERVPPRLLSQLEKLHD